mmetsp:Transcript_1586/g.2911  ORF Transcript_1586/g.2911 Transcript_1586/m.2911 type:complete len:81 (-) Transcript_1586:59-301(-)
MYRLLLVFVLLSVATAFVPAPLAFQPSTTALSAKHAMKKAAKGHNAYRPKKSRPSDKNRKPVVYELTDIKKPAEYTVKGE